MISNLDHETSRIPALLDMIARRAPILMKAGGGPLQEEAAWRPRKPSVDSEQQKAEVLRLGRTGKFSIKEITDMVGSNRSSVGALLYHAGVKARDGRKGRKSPRGMFKHENSL